MTNRRQLQYNILFYKVFRENNYQPVKNAFSSNFLTWLILTLAVYSLKMQYVQKEMLECGLERERELHTSTASVTQVGCRHSTLSDKKGTRRAPAISNSLQAAMHKWDKFLSSVLLLFFIFHCILWLFKNQAFTRKKRQELVILSKYTGKLVI